MKCEAPTKEGNRCKKPGSRSVWDKNGITTLPQPYARVCTVHFKVIMRELKKRDISFDLVKHRREIVI